MTNSFGTPPDPNNLQGDEKMLALFSHLSLFLGGIVLPIIFWATNRDKSKFVTFHALQALWFHIAYVAAILVLVFGFVIIAIIGGVGMGAFMQTNNSGAPVILIFAMVAFYGLLFALIFGAIGYSIYMGIKSYKGEMCMYPIIGKKVYAKVYGSAA
jgi:uncharacterized Tic20 family protein